MSDSHEGEHAESYFLGCDTVLSRTSLPTFRRNVIPPSSRPGTRRACNQQTRTDKKNKRSQFSSVAPRRPLHQNTAGLSLQTTTRSFPFFIDVVPTIEVVWHGMENDQIIMSCLLKKLGRKGALSISKCSYGHLRNVKKEKRVQ
jgi:hypothetical protein